MSTARSISFFCGDQYASETRTSRKARFEHEAGYSSYVRIRFGISKPDCRGDPGQVLGTNVPRSCPEGCGRRRLGTRRSFCSNAPQYPDGSHETLLEGGWNQDKFLEQMFQEVAR